MSEQMWKLRKALLVGAAALALAACSSGGGGGGGGGVDQDGDLDLVNPSDANAMMQALGVKLGGQDATMIDGDPPQSDPDNTENPAVVTDEKSATASPGETKELQVNVNTKGDSVFAVLYAKVSGANSYFSATQGGGAETASFKVMQKQEDSLTLSFDIPLKSDSGRFCVEISAGDNADRVSPTEEVCFDIQTDEFSVATVLRGLQGAWERCISETRNGQTLSARERVDIVGRTVGFSEIFFEGSTCSGTGFGAFADTLRLDVGRKTTLPSGEDVNELNFTIISSPIQSEIGDEAFTLLKLDAANGRFFIGDDEGETEEERATTLEQTPYTRVSRATRTLLGSWKVDPNDPEQADLLLLNFLRDGTYTHAQVDLQNRFPDEIDGMEWGFYQFNALTGRITVQEIFDNNGDIGLNDPDGPNDPLNGAINGDRLVISDIDNEESVTFVRQPSDGLVGTWLIRGRGPDELGLINFFEGAYVLHGFAPNEQEENGMEWAAYEVEPTTGALMVTSTFFDQNGDAGLTEGNTQRDAFFVEVKGRVLTIEVDEGRNGVIDEVAIFDRQ